MQRSSRNLRAVGVSALAVPLCLATLHAMARAPQAQPGPGPRVNPMFTVEDAGFRLLTNSSGAQVGEFFPGINDDGAVASGSDTAVASPPQPLRPRVKKTWVLPPLNLYGGPRPAPAAAGGRGPRLVLGQFHAFKTSNDLATRIDLGTLGGSFSNAYDINTGFNTSR